MEIDWRSHRSPPLTNMAGGRLVLDTNTYRNLCVKVLYRDGWRCRVCKRRQNLVQHHIVYRSHGGDDADHNLITLCSDCHDGVHIRAGLVIMPAVEGQGIDANGVVVFRFVNDWKPGK